MEHVSTTGFPPPPIPPDVGAAPLLQWVPIDKLVVDQRYQRRIYGAGRRNVLRIAADFRWASFAPVVVSPVEGGLYAIVDGQHRTTAVSAKSVAKRPDR